MTIFRKFYLKQSSISNRQASTSGDGGPGLIAANPTDGAPRRRKRRRILAWTFCIVACGLGGTRYLQGQVDRYKDRIYTPETAPGAPVAIVFGAGGAVLEDRVRTGVDLYHAGKVRKLLMTGDNGRVGYNEPETMKARAIQLGVPARDIVCDYAGFRTYDSIYRARDIFGVSRALLVSQSYHLPRALYTATKLGLSVDGVSADRRQYVSQSLYDGREVLSTVVAWIQVNVTHPRPKYLGKKEPIQIA